MVVPRADDDARACSAVTARACRRAGAACGAERGARGLNARRGGAALRRGRGSARAMDLGGGARRGGEEESSVPRPARGRRRVEDGLYYFFSPRRSLRARGSSRASCVRRRARASSGMLRADAVESSARGAGRGSRGQGVPAMDARGEARVVRAAAGERERRRARMGWTSRAMRREGVVVGRGGSGVEVNNGGGVGAN